MPNEIVPNRTHPDSCTPETRTNSGTSGDAGVGKIADRPGGVVIPVNALWASAFVLAGLLGFRLTSLSPTPAYAEMTASDGSYVMMTTAADSEELLYLIDNRTEAISVYHVENRDRFELLERRSLPNVFAVMRARSR